MVVFDKRDLFGSSFLVWAQVSYLALASNVVEACCDSPFVVSVEMFITRNPRESIKFVIELRVIIDNVLCTGFPK